MSDLPRGATVRSDAGLYGYERALRRTGLVHIAGADEAGRGACAGPLVAGAAILTDTKAGVIPGLADSKLLTEKARERCYDQIVRRALSWSVVVIGHEECDRLGMHVANVEALRRAVALLDVPPDYVLTDGFPVDGLGVPGLAVWKGDRVAACIAAGSVLAKVTRDRIMCETGSLSPVYDDRGSHQNSSTRAGRYMAGATAGFADSRLCPHPDPGSKPALPARDVWIS